MFTPLWHFCQIFTKNIMANVVGYKQWCQNLPENAGSPIEQIDRKNSTLKNLG